MTSFSLSFQWKNTKRLKRVSDFRLTDVPAAVFICEVCHELFPSDNAVQQHFESQSCVASVQQSLESTDPLALLTLPALECQYCGLQVVKMALHIELHSPFPGVLKCLYSGCKHMSFPSSEKLKEHLLEHGNKLQNCCPECGKLFDTEERVLRHWQRHAFACNHPGCKHSCTIRSNLKNHKYFVCRGFTRKCHYCFKEFRRLKNLKLHEARHKTQQPGVFKCTLLTCAKKRFNSVADLHNHVRGHGSSEQPSKESAVQVFQCTHLHCKRAFSSAYDLRWHLKRGHVDPQPAKDQTWCLRFLKGRGLSNKKLLKCNVCAQHFKNFEILEFHILNHLKSASDPKLHLPTSKEIINAGVGENIKIEEIVLD